LSQQRFILFALLSCVSCAPASKVNLKVRDFRLGIAEVMSTSQVIVSGEVIDRRSSRSGRPGIQRTKFSLRALVKNRLGRFFAALQVLLSEPEHGVMAADPPLISA